MGAGGQGAVEVGVARLDEFAGDAAPVGGIEHRSRPASALVARDDRRREDIGVPRPPDLRHKVGDDPGVG